MHVPNALKFSRDGIAPEITIETVKIPQTSYATITVSDNGIGIEECYLSDIFRAFKKLHSHTEFPGTGIGLAIVRKTIERHRGEITVTSTVGEGTTFRIKLPTEKRPSVSALQGIDQ